MTTMKKQVMWLGLLVGFGVPMSAQTAAPTLVETKAWLENESAALMGSLSDMTSTDPAYRGLVIRTARTVSELRLESCVLSWTGTQHVSSSSYTGRPLVYKNAVPLKELDIDSIRVQPDSQKSDEPRFEVVMNTRGEVRTIQLSNGFAPDALIPVRSEASGQRVANALRRATELCAAQKSPF
jgi:hypothetical protein